jgi:hypothetical protein
MNSNPKTEKPTHDFKQGQTVRHIKHGHEITIGEVQGDLVHIDMPLPGGGFYSGHVSGAELKKQVS